MLFTNTNMNSNEESCSLILVFLLAKPSKNSVRLCDYGIGKEIIVLL